MFFVNIKQDDVYLLRRNSGGGAVYHDLGNSNMSYSSMLVDYDEQRNY